MRGHFLQGSTRFAQETHEKTPCRRHPFLFRLSICICTQSTIYSFLPQSLIIPISTGYGTVSSLNDVYLYWHSVTIRLVYTFHPYAPEHTFIVIPSGASTMIQTSKWKSFSKIWKVACCIYLPESFLRKKWQSFPFRQKRTPATVFSNTL